MAGAAAVTIALLLGAATPITVMVYVVATALGIMLAATGLILADYRDS